MMRSPRAKWLAGIALVLVVGGAAAAMWWPKQASGVVRGPGPYTRELSICQQGNFVTENRAGVQVTFLPDTVWHHMEAGDRLTVGGQAMMPNAQTGAPQRLNYECTSIRGDLATSSVRPVSSAGTNLNDRNLR